MAVDVTHHGVNEFWNTLKRTTTESLQVQVAKEALDDVEPRAAGRDEVNVKAPIPVRSQYSSSLISLGFSALPSFSIRG